MTNGFIQDDELRESWPANFESQEPYHSHGGPHCNYEKIDFCKQAGTKRQRRYEDDEMLD